MKTRIRRSVAVRLRRLAGKLDPQPVGQTLYYSTVVSSGNTVPPSRWQYGGTIC